MAGGRGTALEVGDGDQDHVAETELVLRAGRAGALSVAGQRGAHLVPHLQMAARHVFRQALQVDLHSGLRALAPAVQLEEGPREAAIVAVVESGLRIGGGRGAADDADPVALFESRHGVRPLLILTEQGKVVLCLLLYSILERYASERRTE